MRDHARVKPTAVGALEPFQGILLAAEWVAAMLKFKNKQQAGDTLPTKTFLRPSGVSITTGPSMGPTTKASPNSIHDVSATVKPR